jgi:hypothetical protein
VEAAQAQFELLPTTTVEVGMIVVPTSTAEVVATATIEATAEATAVPPTVAPLPAFWNSNEFGVFEVGPEGGVCSGDKVAGVQGPVTISFPPNYGGVEVAWGRCVVNGGTAQQIADEDTAAWGRKFMVKEAP